MGRAGPPDRQFVRPLSGGRAENAEIFPLKKISYPLVFFLCDLCVLCGYIWNRLFDPASLVLDAGPDLGRDRPREARGRRASSAVYIIYLGFPTELLGEFYNFRLQPLATVPAELFDPFSIYEMIRNPSSYSFRILHAVVITTTTASIYSLRVPNTQCWHRPASQQIH